MRLESAGVQVREWTNAMGRARIGAGMELVPLVPFVAQLSPFGGTDSVTPLWPLAMVTGLGWAIVGRWRIGLALAGARLIVLYAGLIGLTYLTLSEGCAGEPMCLDDGTSLSRLAAPLLWALCGFYAACSLGSAFFVSRQTSMGTHENRAASDRRL